MIISTYQYPRWQNCHLHGAAGINIYRATGQGCWRNSTLWNQEEKLWPPITARVKAKFIWAIRAEALVWHKGPAPAPNCPLPYQQSLVRTLKLITPCWHFCPAENPQEKPRGLRSAGGHCWQCQQSSAAAILQKLHSFVCVGPACTQNNPGCPCHGDSSLSLPMVTALLSLCDCSTWTEELHTLRSSSLAVINNCLNGSFPFNHQNISGAHLP